MWEDIIKNTVLTKQEVINFMNSLAKETLDKIKAKEGKEPFDLTDGRGGSSLEGYYYTPNYVLEHFPLVGYHGRRGFVEHGSSDKMDVGVDWYDLWNYSFGNAIKSIADRHGEEYRLKEEDKENYPVIQYIAGAYDYENATFGIFCKKEDAWADALMEDINQKLINKFGEPKGKDMYKPEFPMAYDSNTGKNITAEEALSQDKTMKDREDWKDSLRGKE